MSSRNLRLNKRSNLSVEIPGGGTFELVSPSDKVKKQRGGTGPSFFYDQLEFAIRGVLLYDEPGTMEELVEKVQQEIQTSREARS